MRIRMAAKTRKNLEGRVNIPLGPREKALEAQAAMAGISKTRLGRILILNGLEKLEAGSLRLREPGLEEAQ